LYLVSEESYLPKWIGYTFGSLLLLNHFVGSNSYTSYSQGAAPVERPALPEGNKHIFAMSESLSDRDREDLAWETCFLLKNTNIVSLILQSGRCSLRVPISFWYNQCREIRTPLLVKQ
ncbi:hypothetical protein MKX01_033750, partial [Papaver californicum]